MDFEQIKQLVNDHVALLTFKPMGSAEALDRATKFLIVGAHLAEYKRQQDVRKGQLETLKDAVFATALDKTTGKNITEKKALAALDREYAEVANALAESDAAISWARINIRIFENAHITYRMMAKGE